MGNSLGHYPESGFKLYFNPEFTPSPLEDPTFDPNLGFEKKRKERVMVATEDEMRAAKVALKDRDYCAHLLLQYKACRKDVWPWVVKCEHEKHAYASCKYEDFVLRMKEYEREKRMRLWQAKQGEVA